MTESVARRRLTPLHTEAARFDPELPWLLRQKVLLPNRVAGYVDRPAMTRHCDPTQRRLTALQAPGGFGKTTLLAEACRHLRKRDIVVAWLTLNEKDDGDSLASYVSLALSAGGLDVQDAAAAKDAHDHGNYRTNLLLHSIDVHGGPCVLALDEVDRLRDPASLAIVDLMLKHGPPNLHLAMTFRELPAGVDVATPILEGRGVTIAADELRFGKSDVARFFGAQLSRRELSELMAASDGWPIALRVHRNSKTTRTAPGDLASNWIEARLLGGLAADDRDLILDASLFDWLDAEVVDAALGTGTMRRIERMPTLVGLLAKVGNPDAMRLHPLIRQHCIEQRFRETPDRYRSVHRSITDALAGRGQTIAAVRHAAETGDPRLVGEVLENAGGIRLWLRIGPTHLSWANELLTDESIAQFPRLGFVRCIAQMTHDRIDEAKRTYESVAVRTDGFARDRRGGDDRQLAFDAVCFQYVMAFCGCHPIATSAMSVLTSTIAAYTEDRKLDPFGQGLCKYAMAAIEMTRANLDQAVVWLGLARTQFGHMSRYMATFCDLLTGYIAMLRGRPAEAIGAYTRAQRIAKDEFVKDVGPTAITQALLIDLKLEMGDARTLKSRSYRTELDALATSGAWLDVYAAEVGTVVELVRREHGPEAALEALVEADEFARRTMRTTVVRYVASLRVSLLVAAHRLDEAERLWAAEGLPRQTDELVDLGKRTWRETEALASAALRLFTAQSDFETARELKRVLLAVARERGLVRVEMRGLALAIVLERRAGDDDAARAHLLEYVRLFAGTGYAGPLVSEREAALEMFAVIDDLGQDEGLRGAVNRLAGALHDAPGKPKGNVAPSLTTRELEILPRLEAMRDKEIGAALNLSENGVRYHVKSIFRKLGVHGRFEAVRHARTLGILPSKASPQTDETRSPP